MGSDALEGAKHKIATPVSAAMYALLSAIDDTRRAGVIGFFSRESLSPYAGQNAAARSKSPASAQGLCWSRIG